MIDLEMARGLLARAVLTQGPDFVYHTAGSGWCFNVPQSKSIEPNKRKTGCLVGTAMKLAGVPVEEQPAASINNDFFNQYRNETARCYLSIAQLAQDSGCTWGEAYNKAEALVYKKGLA